MEELNYEKRYAYAELEVIINHLGEKYKSKIPPKILREIKEEKKYGYIPDFDFSKPLSDQITRQETKNMIAFLYHEYWCENEEEKKKLEQAILKNQQDEKEKQKRARKDEIAKKAHMNFVSLDTALKEKSEKK